jgi:hypothetical protein
MPATVSRTDRPQALFDAAGNHLHLHGDPSMQSSVSTARRLGVLPQLQVMTRAEGKTRTAPEVVLFTAEQPFIFDWRMTPAAARALAANLHRAADMADQVEAAHRASSKGGQ